MAENLITQAELEAYAPDLDLSQFSAATISGMISSASQKVVNYCNVKGFVRSAVTDERNRALINSQGELVISFERRPVATANDVSAVRLLRTDIEQELTLRTDAGDNYFHLSSDGTYMIYPSNFLIAHGSGLISLDNANLFYSVDYTGGYATSDMPEDIKEAVTLYIRSRVAKKYNSAGVSSFSQGSVSMSFGSNKGGKDMLIQEAESILADYVRRVI